MYNEQNLEVKRSKLQMIGINAAIENGCLVYIKNSQDNLGETEIIVEVHDDGRALKICDFICLRNFGVPKLAKLILKGPGRVKNIMIGKWSHSSFDTSTIAEVLFDLDTSNVTNMSHMFRSMQELRKIEFVRIDTSNVTEMELMFSGCSQLSAIDLSKFRTPRLKDVSHMFDMCGRLKIIDLSTFDMSRVDALDYLFSRCVSLQKVILPPKNLFKLNNTKRFVGVFGECSKLIELDLSSIEGKHIESMVGAFEHCISLSKVRLDNFVSSGELDLDWVFSNCSNLSYLNLKRLKLKEFDEPVSMITTDKKLRLVLHEPLTGSEKASQEKLINMLKYLQNIDLSIEYWDGIE